jgi:uncharacterized protein YggE
LLFAILLTAFAARAQEAGGSVYQARQRPKTDNPEGILTATDKVEGYLVEAKVLLNAPADEYVAVFGVAQEGLTASESANKTDAQIAAFLTGLNALGIKGPDVFVDYVVQTRIYDYEAVSATRIEEKLKGFVTKKNVAVRYAQRDQRDKILAAATKAEIFDLIKIDYVVKDLAAVRARLLEEAAKIVRQKQEKYERLFSVKLRPLGVAQEKYDVRYPSESYSRYTAYETGEVRNYYEDRRSVIALRKLTTFFYDALDTGDFDVVVNPLGISPEAQCTLFLRVRYEIVK